MRPILLSAVLLNLMLLQACASWSRQSPEARPAVNLATAHVPILPSTPSPFGLSERPPSHATAVAKPVDIDQYLRPRSRSSHLAAKHVVTTKRTPVRSAAPEPAVAPAPAPAVVASAEPEQIAAVVRQPSPEERSQDATRYAQREQQAPGLQAFQGGDAVVITMSTLVVVLLIVLLIVLIVN